MGSLRVSNPDSKDPWIFMFIRYLSDTLKWNPLLINGGYQSDFAVWEMVPKSGQSVYDHWLDSYERAINV